MRTEPITTKKGLQSIIIGLLLFFQLNLHAQEAYLRVGGGYSISTSNDVFTLRISEQDSNNLYLSDRNIYGTIGSGAQFRLCGGYAFAQNFGFELDVNYLMGQKKYAGERKTPFQTDITYAYTRQLRITPSFFVRANAGFVQPYAGMGIVLPVFGKTVLEEESNNASRFAYKERDVFGAVSVGFESYAGVNFQWPNKKFNLFLEFRYTGLRIKSKNATLVQWTETDAVSGEVTDRLVDAPLFLVETVFVDELTRESNTITATVYSANFDFDKPLELLASKTNFNSIGINIGVCLKFGKEKETTANRIEN